MNKSVEFVHKQLERSFYPVNELKREQVLSKQELNNAINNLKKGASTQATVEALEKIDESFNKMASNILSIELYIRSMKHPLQERLGKEVNKHV